jgi:tRNA threonylcarbamoyladenosine biosynthesis protein TsaB
MNELPKILSIESSGSVCGVCLSEGNIILADYSLFGRNIHDKLLAELIRRILQDNDLSIDKIDAVAVSSGPGSFTGLRIGSAIAKGICFDNHPKLIAVPTLYAVAFTAKDFLNTINFDGIIAAVPSHKDLLYYQEFDCEANPLAEIKITDKDTFSKLELNNKLIGGMQFGFIPNSVNIEYTNKLSPVFIAKAAYQFYKESKFVDSDEFTPDYIMDFEPKKIK